MPYRLVLIALAWLASLAGATWWAYGHGIDTQRGRQAQQQQAAAQQHQVAELQAAASVVRVQVQQQAIAQEVQREIEIQTVYRDCEHSAEQLQRINAALGTGGADPAGGGQLPAAHATDQPELWRHHGQAGAAGDDLPHLPGSPGSGPGAPAQADVGAQPASHAVQAEAP